MTRRYEPIGELDLYAYADGLLEGDAIRRAEIERYLAGDAEAAAYVAEIRAQNRAIREAFGDVGVQPLPERLVGVLAQGDGRRGRRVAAASAAAVLLAVAVAAGWLAGQRGDEDAWALEEFARRAAIQHQLGATGSTLRPAGAASSPAVAEPLAWLNQRIALEIKAPDLTGEGFELTAKTTVGTADERIVQLVYRNHEGELLNLFLRPRWEERASPIGLVRSDDVAVHYWLDGPLAFALTSNVQEADAERLARAVHEAVQRSRLTEPAPKPILSEGVTQFDGSGGEGAGMPASSPPGPVENRRAAPRPQFN